MKVALAARSTTSSRRLAARPARKVFACDARRRRREAVRALEARLGAPDVVVYNASFRTRGAFYRSRPGGCREGDRGLGVRWISRGAAGGAPHAAEGQGAILFTGASASVKGYAQSAPFAMGKFALRGLAQSLARELSPRGIHVAHFVIEAASAASAVRPPDKPDALLDPDAIAESYLHVLKQPRSAWTSEIELRPWVENF